jgi:hypothetical protein
MSDSEVTSVSRQRFVRNVLVTGGLLFFFGVIGSPVSYFWGRAVIYGHIFQGLSGVLLARILGLVPECLVAAGLGWALPRFVESSRTREWALAFALYLGLWHYFNVQWIRPELSDRVIHLGAAVLLGAAAFGGYVVSSRGRLPSTGGGAV